MNPFHMDSDLLSPGSVVNVREYYSFIKDWCIINVLLPLSFYSPENAELRNNKGWRSNKLIISTRYNSVLETGVYKQYFIILNILWFSYPTSEIIKICLFYSWKCSNLY